MTSLKPLLETLCTVPGMSAYESPIRETIQNYWAPLTDSIKTTPIGNLVAVKNGTGAETRPTILLAAHMDMIGLMVTQLVEGFLKVGPIGGIDNRVLPGSIVTVHTTSGDLSGVVASKPPHLQTAAERKEYLPLTDLYIDLGLPPADVEKAVKLGDLVSFAQTPSFLNDGTLVARSLDNRASVAAVTLCLDYLQNRTHAWDVVATATVQEEVGLVGAYAAGFAEKPDMAIVIDVTFGRQSGTSDWETFKLGAGPTLGWGANLHPKFYEKIEKVAADLEMTIHRDLLPRSSGTDAIGMQVSRDGIPTALISIPIKNMHTPIETVVLKDIERSARLMAEVIATLDETTLTDLSFTVGADV